MSSDKTLGRIAGLLRKAESTDNEHEADAFLAAAQRLATQASIDLAVARAHTARRERRATPIQRVVEIGQTGKKGLRTYVQLFVNIAHANDVRCDVARNSTYVHAYGFETDIDTAQALYSSVVIQMVRASDNYLKTGAYRDEMVGRVVEIGRGWRRRQIVESVPVAPITARLSFQTAYAGRIGSRLAEAKEQTEAAVVAEAQSQSTVLALRDKQLEIVSFYDQTSTARGSWRGGSGGSNFSHTAAAAGDRAARNARLTEQQGLAGPRKQLSG